MTHERILAVSSGTGALVSISIEQVNATISITAGVAAILCAIPVIADRWAPKLRAWFGRVATEKPPEPPPPPPPEQ